MTYKYPAPVELNGASNSVMGYTETHLKAAHAAGRSSRDAEVEALKTELREGDDLRTHLSSLLTRSVNAIRGEPEPLHLHSWHDLPELVEALRADAERYRWLRSRTWANSPDVFSFKTMVAPVGTSLMKGSVAQHLDKAIDAARKEKQDE